MMSGEGWLPSWKLQEELDLQQLQWDGGGLQAGSSLQGPAGLASGAHWCLSSRMIHTCCFWELLLGPASLSGLSSPEHRAGGLLCA